MSISIECAPGEAGWKEIHIGEWLQREDQLVLNLANWSPQSLLNRFDIRLRFRSGEADLYRYFPFAFKLSGNAPQAEIGEIEGPDQAIELMIEHVAAEWRGQLRFSFMSEQSGTPKSLGVGRDERNLALRLEAVLCRQREPIVLPPANTPSCADLDLDGRSEMAAPIFVVGSGRCGSSVLTWALGQHPNIVPLDETGWLPMTLYGATAGYRMASAPTRNFPTEYGISLDDFLRFIGSSIDRLHRSAARSHAQTDFLQRLSGRADFFDPSFQRIRTNWSPKRRWVDGTPFNTSTMPLLARAFPDGQFIGIIRNPRDVLASYTQFHTVGGPVYSIEEAATTWLQAAWMVLWMRDRLGPGRVMIVDYEEFADQEELLRRALRFLGEPNCTACIKPMQRRINSSNVSGDMREQISGPLVDRCIETYDAIRGGASWKAIEWDERLCLSHEQWFEDLMGRLIKTVS